MRTLLEQWVRRPNPTLRLHPAVPTGWVQPVIFFKMLRLAGPGTVVYVSSLLLQFPRQYAAMSAACRRRAAEFVPGRFAEQISQQFEAEFARLPLAPVPGAGTFCGAGHSRRPVASVNCIL